MLRPMTQSGDRP